MSNYTKATNFASKDALLTGNPSKIIKGTEIDNEFTAISTAVSTKFDTASLAAPGPIGETTPAAISGTTGTFSGNVQMGSLNGGAISLRNKIINGSFTVNQRGWTSGTPASGDYTLDRWFAIQTVAGKFSVATGAVNTTAAAARVSGALTTITSLSPYTVGAGEGYLFSQRIEGYNIADLLWGSANAKTVTLSFYVTSTLVGTFGGAIKNSANTRSYPFSYSIPVANTWTRISVTITGDTGGAFTDWLTTNGIGMVVVFSVGSGSTLSGTAGAWAATNYNSVTSAVSVVGTNAATWTIANVQLEVGPVATPFEQRPIGMELALCQRYLPRVSNGSGFAYALNAGQFMFPFEVSPRVSATGVTVLTHGLLNCTGTPRTADGATFVRGDGNSGVLNIGNSTLNFTATVGQGATLLSGDYLFTGCEI